MIRIYDDIHADSVEMRKYYCDALIEAAQQNDKVVILDCDLSNSVGTKAFYERFPDRAFNCGIEEANACGVAAGLSVTGYIPFFHSFAVFTSRRICDQVFLSCAYAGQNVKLIGGDAGVSAAFNGGTHMSFEDIGVLRSIPGITIVEPSDGVMLRAIFPQITDTYGVFYMRMPRKKIDRVYREGSEFRIGRAAVAAEGDDVTIIASGIMVAEALKAAKALSGEGISSRVVDMFTIKPVDRDIIIGSAQRTGAIVTAENHNIIGGLGSAVAEVLTESCPVPQERVGVNDRFGVVGEQQYLQKFFGLTAEVIAEKAKKVIARKKGQT